MLSTVRAKNLCFIGISSIRFKFIVLSASHLTSRNDKDCKPQSSLDTVPMLSISFVLVLLTFTVIDSVSGYYYHRIVNGSEYLIEEAPYNLGLINEADEQICGAILTMHYSQQVILTAAHCLSEAHEPQPVTGKKIRGGGTNKDEGVIIPLKDAIIYEDFDYYAGYEHDIAILIPEEPFELSDKIRPVKLPSFDTPEPKELLVTGWGRLGEGVGAETSEVLRGVYLPVITNEECYKMYEKYYYEDHGQIHFSQICTLNPGGGKDACIGDSGGPAVMFQDNEIYLAGIISWAEGCARADAPGVYTKVKEYVPWIKDNAGKITYG